MKRVWTAVYVGWLAYCLGACASHRIALPLARYIISPLSAMLAAVVGSVLGWFAVRALGGSLRWPHWKRWRTWPAAARLGAVAFLLCFTVLALDIRHGDLRTVFGMYLAASFLLWFVTAGGTMTVGQVGDADRGATGAV